eukprot:14120467-Alexandrium_andersonii.AAC.1
MSASLVGSEMCIRDRPPHTGQVVISCSIALLGRLCKHCPPTPRASVSVSYTHLTLPTICSV